MTRRSRKEGACVKMRRAVALQRVVEAPPPTEVGANLKALPKGEALQPLISTPPGGCILSLSLSAEVFVQFSLNIIGDGL